MRIINNYFIIIFLVFYEQSIGTLDFHWKPLNIQILSDEINKGLF